MVNQCSFSYSNIINNKSWAAQYIMYGKVCPMDIMTGFNILKNSFNILMLKDERVQPFSLPKHLKDSKFLVQLFAMTER